MWVVKASVYITPILTLLYNSTNKLYNNKLLTLLLQISFRDNAPIYWNKRSHIVKPDRISPRRGKIGEIESAQTTVIIETEANLIDWTPDGRQWSEKEKSKMRKCVKVVRHWPSRLDEINDDLCVSISSFFFLFVSFHTLTVARMAMLKSVRNVVAIQPTTRMPCFGSRQQTTGASFEPPGLGTLSW